MASKPATSDQITASDMMAVAKLAAGAGFEDGAKAKAHYEPFLHHGYPGDALRKRLSSDEDEATSARAKTETRARNQYTSCYLSDHQEGET
ncbi:hypothetical protein HD806DRAFT_528774 [Xylariaceae sp. AK1471]|nr:hypothetical protein HD806DRAFT_528774 [Xylariaceae sp. AK1471]